jgi:heme oxygenase (biliverdin-producing, ferredoxin)
MTVTQTPFSALLRERTASAHTSAENAPFLLALAQGRVTREGVVGVLQRLLPLYVALEDVAVGWAGDPDVGPLLVPGLERAGRLRADLEALGAPLEVASPAADAYAARVREVGTSAPAYVGHHYTRYLGDLSGGQVIGAALARSHGLVLSFFSFDLRGPAVKRDYRAHLDALPWTAEQQEAAVAEADVAFRCNEALAAELTAEVLA